MKILIKGKVWLYPGLAGWHFVYAGKEDSERLRRPDGKRVRKGFIPIRATLGDTTWDTSLFPHKGEPYLLSIKASVRKAEGIFVGDTVTVHCTLR